MSQRQSSSTPTLTAEPKPQRPTLRIAIVGAGPSGLMLARLLSQSQLQLQSASGSESSATASSKHPLQTQTQISISISIFESDISASSRASQGSTLDLHPRSGLAAIRKAGLWDEFSKHVRYDGEALTMMDKTGYIFHQNAGSAADPRRSNGRPEIDRAALRDLLLRALPETCVVSWGRRLSTVRERKMGDGNGGVGLGRLELLFKDGSVETGFDLVVGADGAWSKVRSSFVDDEQQQQPEYSGICGFTFRISNAAVKDPETYRLANRGSMFSYSDAKAIHAQFVGDQSVRVSAWLKRDRWSEEERQLLKSKDAVLRFVRQNYLDWTDKLTGVFDKIDVSEDGMVDGFTADLFMLPVDWRWEHKRGVTLIGDAAHLMTPFAGEGVNLALGDAMELAEAIAAAVSTVEVQQQEDTKTLLQTLDRHIAEFEDKMYIRSKEMRRITYDNMVDQFSNEPMSTWIARVGARTLLATDPRLCFGSEFLVRALLEAAFSIGRFIQWTKGSLAVGRCVK